MSIFSKEKYVLWNIEEKEIVWEGKELLTKEAVLKDINDENLEDALYRLEIWKSGTKVRNAWIMKKPKKKLTAEEIAANGREEAEAYIQQKAIDIKKDVEDYQTFVTKIRKMYSIEGGDNMDKIKIPTGKDGNLGIIEAAQLATAESVYRGISETKPTEVAASFKSVMDSGTTILAGIAQMLTARMMESKKKPGKKEKPEVKKEVPEKKKEEPKLEPKKEEVKVHKEDLGDGKTKTTFGSDASTSLDYNYQKTDTTYNGSDTPKAPVTYEEYEKDMIGINKEEVEEEPETA